MEKHSPIKKGRAPNAKLIPIGSIKPDEDQSRTVFDEGELSSLADSIRQVGILSPLLVRKKGGRYIIIAGERRFRAAKKAGLTHLPCIVFEMSREDTAIASLTENIQRQDLDPFDEAIGIKKLMEFCNMTQQEVAVKLGRSQSSIANKLRLLSIEEELRDRMRAAGLTERHARAMLTLPESDRSAALDYIISHKLNVEAAERYIKYKLTVKGRQKKKAYFKDLRLFINTIDKSIRYLSGAGIEATAKKTDDGEFIHYYISIPKGRTAS